MNIDLQSLDYYLNQRTMKEARTSGFSDKAIMITIEAKTSNGEINLAI